MDLTKIEEIKVAYELGVDGKGKIAKMFDFHPSYLTKLAKKHNWEYGSNKNEIKAKVVAKMATKITLSDKIAEKAVDHASDYLEKINKVSGFVDESIKKLQEGSTQESIKLEAERIKAYKLGADVRVRTLTQSMRLFRNQGIGKKNGLIRLGLMKCLTNQKGEMRITAR
jgi:hypothetical protein